MFCLDSEAKPPKKLAGSPIQANHTSLLQTDKVRGENSPGHPMGKSGRRELSQVPGHKWDELEVLIQGQEAGMVCKPTGRETSTPKGQGTCSFFYCWAFPLHICSSGLPAPFFLCCPTSNSWPLSVACGTLVLNQGLNLKFLKGSMSPNHWTTRKPSPQPLLNLKPCAVASS